MKRETATNLLVFCLLVSLGVFTRWLSKASEPVISSFLPFVSEPNLANFTATGAVALFAGYFFSNRFASFLAPLTVLVISNLWLDKYNTPEEMAIVYFAFLLPVPLGWVLKKHFSVGKLIGFAILPGLIFFLVTNCVYWHGLDLYPKTWAGQWQSYVAAIPFYRNTLLGDLFFTGLIFGAYQAAVSAGVIARPIAQPAVALATAKSAE